MASFHCSARIGGKGCGGSHASYIAREGKFQGYERYEDLVAKGSGNMPAWAAANPVDFWKAADEGERVKGSVYRELTVALPRELTLEQNKLLFEDYMKRVIGEEYAYQWAIHDKKASLEKGDQMHGHCMRSTRKRDGIERDPDQYFKRYNPKHPEKGGAQKERGKLDDYREALRYERKLWAEVQNEHLAKHGHIARVDHRSYKEQGIDRMPEGHLGPVRINKMTEEEIESFIEHRRIEDERELVHAEIDALIVDLPGDIKEAQSMVIEQKAEANAKQLEQRIQERAEAAKAAERERAAAEQAKQEQANRDMQERRQAYLAEQAAKIAQAERHQVKPPAPAPKKSWGMDGPG